MNNIKIGVTITILTYEDSIWTNGIKLNTLIFTTLLKKSLKNYQVCLLNSTDLDLSTKKPKYLEGIDVYKFEDKYEEMDLIVTMGAQVHENHLKHFRSLPNKRVVAYKCGNNYIVHTENVLFKPSEERPFQYETELDEIWYVPQQHETNCGYYETLHRTRSLIVPFLWHQSYLIDTIVDIEKEFVQGKFKKGFKYDRTKEKKVIGTMEPNLNIVKYCLIPTMIVEESYRTEIGKNKIEKMMITNSENVSKHKEFLSIIKTFDLHTDGKISADARYQTSFIVSQYLDVVVCHQLLNPLNYIYLDVAYMGYPVLHNAPMCKDLGYYYEGSDTKDGARQLNWILENHDNHIDEYNEKNKKALWRYSINNPELVATYDKLIYNLFNGGNHELIYDETTNLYKNL
jgi:hypothetical protein